VAQLGARLDGIEEVVGSNPIGSTSSSQSQRVAGNLTLQSKQGAQPMLNLDQDDLHSLALVAWKEARGEGDAGMDAVMHVIVNRAGHPGFAAKLHDCIYGKNQFTSMSVPSDPEFNLQPKDGDPQFAFCMANAQGFQQDGLADPTQGAHFYADLTYVTSGWFVNHIVNDPANHPHTVKIGRHDFYV
jgi:N-acetylmuramoyl-L-alanine amidase